MKNTPAPSAPDETIGTLSALLEHVQECVLTGWQDKALYEKAAEIVARAQHPQAVRLDKEDLAYPKSSNRNEEKQMVSLENKPNEHLRAVESAHLIFITQSEGRWTASCDTVTGLNIEADTKEQAVAEVKRWVPELIADNAYLISTSAVAIQKSGQNNEITMNGTERPIESLITKSENTQELADKVTAQYGDCQQPHPHMPPYTYSAGISIEALEGLVAEMEARMESNNEKNGKNPYHAGAMTENTGLLFAIALLRRFIDTAPSDKNAALRTVNGLGGGEDEKTAPPCGIIDGRGAV